MSIIVYDSGKRWLLDYLTGQGGSNLIGMVAKLFVNNQTPGHADTLAMYTIAAWAGYANQLLAGFGPSALDGTFHAFSTASQIAFPNGSGVAQQAYGYIVTDAAQSTLVFGERFAGAPVAIPAGLGLGVQITFTQQSEF
jgi:hypothetical protein